MGNDVIHKEIDLIQNVINRLANNSFLLKGWAVSLVAVILTFANDDLRSHSIEVLLIILCLPVILFWYLDAFFLNREQCYRKLYKWVIENRKNTDEYLYSLDYNRFAKEAGSIFKSMFTRTLIVFYGFTLVVLIGIIIYLKCVV